VELIVVAENPALFRRAVQHQFVIEIIQSCTLSGLEIDAGLVAQRRID
jgi:hypothetical protein